MAEGLFCFKFKCSPTLSTKNYFSLKSRTPMALSANAVFKFTCLCDTGKFYIGKTKKHIVERVGERLNLKQNKPSAIKSHIFSCETCFNSKLGCHNFEILKKCQSDYDSQISEAFFIKKLKPEMNSQLFNSGSSFLLNIFN